MTLKSIGDAVVTTDTENNVVMLNKAAEAITGWQQEAAAGKPLSEVMIIVNDDKDDILECHPSTASENRNGHTYLKILKSRDGSKRTISVSEASIRDDGGGIFGNVIVFRDVTLEKQREAEVRYLGYHDSLTGLYNRAYFEEALSGLDDDKHPPGIDNGRFKRTQDDQ